MSLGNLDSGQIACLTLSVIMLVAMLIFCVFEPKFINRVDAWLTAKFLQYCEQRRAEQAQGKANHPPKRTPEETGFLYFKISFLTMLVCFIGALVLCVTCLLQGKYELGPVERIIAIALWIITMFSFVLGVYTDDYSPKKENPTTPTAEAKDAATDKNPEP